MGWLRFVRVLLGLYAPRIFVLGLLVGMSAAIGCSGKGGAAVDAIDPAERAATSDSGSLPATDAAVLPDTSEPIDASSDAGSDARASDSSGDDDTGGDAASDATLDASGDAADSALDAAASDASDASDAASDARVEAAVDAAPAIVVGVSPAAITLGEGESTSFVATVTNAANTVVTWSVLEGAAGGSVTSDGTYTAPYVAGTYHVVATSNADGSTSASATVTVPPLVISLSKTAFTSDQGAKTAVTATLTGAADTTIDWSVTETGGGSYAAGVYTAPFASGTFHLVAASRADPTQKATVTITVATVTVTIDNPPPSIVEQSAQSTFTATVTGTVDTAVTWSVTVGCGFTGTSTGLFAAANHAATGCTLTATSVSDGTKKATAAFVVPAVTVTMTPTSASVAPGATVGVTASVQGAVDKSVTYSVDVGGTGGTVNALGVYYAPNSTGVATVRAKSNADPTKSVTSAITVSSTIGVSITPSVVTLSHGQSQTFATTVTGTTNASVTWSVVGGAANGTITAAGVYTAPNTDGQRTVVAKSVADGATQGTATVNVVASAQVSVSVSPSGVSLSPGESFSFVSSVAGAADTSVTWDVVEAGGGTIDVLGAYTAPSAPGTYHVVATSVADVSKTGVATITVSAGPPVSIRVAPSTITLAPTGSKTFAATVLGSANTAVTWSATCGAVDAAGAYVAPASPSFCVVSATSVADGTKTASAAVTVTSTISVAVGPTPVTVANGSSQAFTATVAGSLVNAVTWSVSGGAGTGSIDSSGVFTTIGATATPPYSVTVKAVSQADGSTFGQANVDVVDSSVHTVAGTVSYGGAKAGRIYIDLIRNDSGQVVGGTSIAAPGPFTIRALTYAANYHLLAWQDVPGLINPRPATDPMGSSGTFAFDGATDVSGLSVALSDPTPATPAMPTILQVVVGDATAFVRFDPVKDSQGFDIADHYDVFVSTTPNPGPQNHVLRRSVRESNGAVALSPLSNGTAYYVAISAVNSAGTSALATTGPFTVAPSTGANNVSGTVNLTGVVASGPLYFYVATADRTKTFIARVATPGAIANFSIAGVPDGAISYGVVLDQDADGELGMLDPTIRISRATVSGSTTLPVMSLPAALAVPKVTTDHWKNASGLESYGAKFRTFSNKKILATVTLMSGAQLGNAVPRDLGVLLDRGEPGVFGLDSIMLAGAPKIGDGYGGVASFVDGEVVSVGADVTNVLALPTNLSPATTGVGTTPGFTWLGPTGPTLTYGLAVVPIPWGGSAALWELFDLYALPATPIVYGFNGTATPLTVGVEYEWYSYVFDANDNRASAAARFSP